jgi:hypothetical protein
MLIFVSAVFVSIRHGCTNVVDGVIPGTGDGECCGAGVYFGDGEGFVCKVVLLEGELAEAHWAWEVAEGKVHSLSGSSAEGA